MTTKKYAFAFLFLLIPFLLIAQQITKFAVVDTTRIYSTFYRDSRSVRDFESKKKQFQDEIQRMSVELKQLRQQKVDATTINDLTLASKLDIQIESKTKILVDYTKAKNSELDSLKQKLVTDDFYSILYDVLKKIGEEEGYSMVLSLQEGTSILWYSPTVDITDKVIKLITTKQ